MYEKANMNFTFYMTKSIRDELRRQAKIYSNGVLTHHIRKCVEIGIEKFKEDEKNYTPPNPDVADKTE